MSEKIKSLAELARKLDNHSFLLQENMILAVATSAVKVQAKAKEKFGGYQPAIGGFPAWASLAESTVLQKEKAGGAEDPLIGHYQHKTGGGAGGDLRNSILTKSDGLSAAVGTNDKIGIYHEYGTRKIPPRPFLRPALYEEQGFIKTEFRKAIIKTLSGI